MLSLPKIVDKTWGTEIWYANDEVNNYCGKILKINAGQKLSMHYHLIKNETFFLLNGDAVVTIIDTKEGKEVIHTMSQNTCFEIKVGLPHRIESENGCIILEASTFHRDSDSYRLYR
jgi:mannose-6-phosphate isomerase-like protein (cupin superfamily)